MKETYECLKCNRFYSEEIICPYCLDKITQLCGSISVNYQDAQEFVEWAKDKAFCNSGQHICDRLAIHFEQELEKTKIK
jgi:hypothetical protein